MQKIPVLYKTLVVGVVILFCSISVQPCIAIVQNNERLEPYSETDGDKGERWFATLQMDISDEIYNHKIKWWRRHLYLGGRWYIDVSIGFRCPSDRKVEVEYTYEAKFLSHDVGHIFFDKEGSVTIINGSNPPDINRTESKLCHGAVGGTWLLILRIKANITVYKYFGGEWVLIDEDEKKKEVKTRIEFINSRTSERIHFLMRFFERFPNVEVFLRIMNLLR